MSQPKANEAPQTVPAIQHPDFVLLLMAATLRSVEFMSRAGYRLRPTDFARGGEKGWQLVVTIAVNYWENHRSVIPLNLLLMEIDTRLEDNTEFLDTDAILELKEQVQFLYTVPEEAYPVSWMLEQTQFFLTDRRMRAPARAMAVADSTEIDAAIEAMNQEYRNSRISFATTPQSFVPGKATLNQIARKPTGMIVMDLLTGGGWGAGELVGILGPTGGGKSTLGVQCCGTFARKDAGHHVGYAAFEYPFEPDFQIRFYSFMTAIPHMRLRGHTGFDALDREDRLRIEEEIERYGQFIHPFDMVSGGEKSGSGGVDELRAIFRDCASAGTPLELMVIDQLLPMVTRYMNARGIPSTELTKVIQNMNDPLMKLATDYNATILVLHQASTEALQRPPYARPVPGDSAECKSWPFWMNSCYQLGTRDVNDLCWLKAVKSRSSGLEEAIVRLNGPLCRFDYEPNKFALEGRKFVDLSQVSETGVIDTGATENLRS